MEELEKTARELILAITENTLKSLKDKGLLKEPSKLQMLCSSPEMKSLIKKLSAPKYDLCRKFRKGDKVRVVEWGGRNPVLPFMDCKVGDIGTVIKDEESTSFFVRLHLEGKYEKDMPYCHLELVTPVEEQEPYTVDECCFAPTLYVRKNGKVYLTIPYKEGSSLFQTREEALAAAEAERDRLNAEYRKEQDNG